MGVGSQSLYDQSFETGKLLEFSLGCATIVNIAEWL